MSYLHCSCAHLQILIYRADYIIRNLKLQSGGGGSLIKSMRSIIFAFQDLSMKHSLRSHEAFALQTRSIELKFNMKQSVPLIKHAPKVRFIGQSPASFFMCDARFISKKKKALPKKCFSFWQYHPNLNHGYVSATAGDLSPAVNYLFSFINSELHRIHIRD